MTQEPVGYTSVIVQLEARNYRCLRLVRRPLPGFAVLVGPNGSGKSTLLDVPGLLAEVVRGREGLGAAVAARAADWDDVTWQRQGGGIELAVEARVPPAFWRQAQGETGRVRYEVAIGRREPGGEVGLLAETLWLRPEPELNAATAAPTLFPLPEPPEESVVCPPGYPTPAGWRRVAHKAPNAGNDYFRSEVSDWNNTFRLGPRRSALANLPEDEDQFPAAVWLRRLLTTGVRRLAPDGAALRQPSPAGAPAALDTAGANLAAVVADLEQREPARLAAWVAHLRTALPALAGVGTALQPNGGRGLVLDYANGMEVAAAQVGEGTLRLLALTAPAYAPGVDGVWVVEEPERGLDPRAVAAVMQSLRSVYGAQVLVVSYVPGVLGMADPACVLCFEQDGTGATTIVSAAEHPRLKDRQGEVNPGALYAG